MNDMCKNKKRICIIRSNPVKPDSRVEKVAWSLSKAGYHVHILAWDRSTDIKESDGYVEIAGESIPITRLGYKASYGEGFKNLKAYLSFQFHMRKWLRKNDFDAIHACDFDTAFFSLGIVKIKKEKFIYDIFDFLYGEPKNLFQKIVKRAQIRIVNNADATIICTEERKNQIAGSKPRKLVVIHNTPSMAQIGKIENNKSKSNRVKIVYVGILQNGRLLKEIAKVISESDDLELHIGGFGKNESFFVEMAKRFNNIYFYGCLPYDQTLALENKCDVMLAIYDPAIENHRYAAPNKFYESLMLGKPVIMVKNTGMSQVIQENDIGVLIDYSKEGFLQGINALVKRKNEWPMMSQKMKTLHREEFSWEEMERRIVEMYGSLI